MVAASASGSRERLDDSVLVQDTGPEPVASGVLEDHATSTAAGSPVACAVEHLIRAAELGAHDADISLEHRINLLCVRLDGAATADVCTDHPALHQVSCPPPPPSSHQRHLSA